MELVITYTYDNAGNLIEYRVSAISPQPPVASFTYSPAYPVVNQTITFNASGSYDLDGLITNYKWDFGESRILCYTNCSRAIPFGWKYDHIHA